VNARSPFPDSLLRTARQCRPLSRARGAFRRGSPGRSPSRAPALEPCSRWPTGAGAARAHRGSRTSTRPSPHRSRGRFMAACASTTSADRCFNEHDDGPLEHPGPRKTVAGTAAFSRSIVAFRSTATAEGAQGQGSRITEPRPSLAGLLPKETLPRPRLLQTPRVAGIAGHPVWSRRGGLAKPPAPRALARRALREGGAAPDFREEIRRAFTRGAFRRKAVRERERGSAGVGRSIERSSAFFTARETARGTLARGLCSSAFR